MKRLTLLISLILFSSVMQAEKKLNFLFFLVDDLGKMDIGIEGSTFYETPHIDALAADGLRFTNGYATCQVCSPSRASILLGTYPARNKITDWIGAATGTDWNRNDRVLPVENAHVLPNADTTLPEAMRQGGYKTFFAGKWHLGGEGSYPEDHGFDINIAGHHRGSPPGGFFSPYKNPKMEDGPTGESLTLRLARETADFIGAQKNATKPFFAYLSFYAVHSPLETTETLWKKYHQKAHKKGLVNKRFIFDRTKGVRQVQDNPLYAGMMETLDNAIGIVMQRLKDSGLDKNTVVIFTGDNGGVSSGDAFATSLLPFRGGKGRQWEGGIREPYYIYVPGMTKANSSTDIPATGTDFFPTILDLAGLKQLPQQHKDGVSLVPLLKGASIAKRDLFWHYPHYGNQGGEPSSVIRSGNWKLIHYYEDGRDELYNLSDDIGEQSDLAKSNPELVKNMRRKLNSWLKDTQALIPQADKRFNAKRKKIQLKKAANQQMQRLETQHANFLKADYQPNKTWWDSKIPRD